MEASWSVVKRWKGLLKAAQKITADELQILYKKDGLLAISKPYGMPVHSGPGMGKSVLDIMDDFKKVHGLTEKPRLLHRLDKNTSGLLLLAYNECMARKMSELFHDKKVFKTYLGVTCGVPKSPNGVIVDRICEGVVGSQKMHRMVTINDTQIEDQVVGTGCQIKHASNPTIMGTTSCEWKGHLFNIIQFETDDRGGC